MKSKKLIQSLNQMDNSAFSLLQGGFVLSIIMLFVALLLHGLYRINGGNFLSAYHMGWELFSIAPLIFFLSGIGAIILEEKKKK